MWPVILRLLGICVVTAVLVVLQLHHGPIYTELWLMGILAELAVYAVAIGCYGFLLIGLGSRKRALIAGALVMLTGLACGPVLWTDSVLRAQMRFALERPAFDRIAALARAGRLGDLEKEYYGVPLPGMLCYVSANCRVAALGYSDGQPVLFVPDSVGIPDDAVGFGHFAGEAGDSYDGFGLVICPKKELGGGWWWLDRC